MHRYQSTTFYLQIVPFIFVYLVLNAHVSADYVFEVFPVEKCPTCKEDWEMASRRLNCNRTHGYHCVPNKQFTSLIEFCYPKGPKFLFEKGNCLELAANGILNQVPCAETFEDGCPKNHYFSNEMYNFPRCLMISKSLRCFDADHECIYSKLLENTMKEQDITTTKSNVTTIESEVTTTESNTLQDGGNQCLNIERKDESTAVITSLAIIIVTIVIGLFVVVVYMKMRRRIKGTPGRRRNKDILRIRRDKDTLERLDVTEETYLSIVESIAEDGDSAFEDEPFISDDKENMMTKKEALQKLHDLIQGREFDELKHHIQNFDRNALEQLNPRGFNSLHLAAKGESKMHQPRMNIMLVATVIFTYIVLQSYAEYAFEVFPVEKCPMSKEGWAISSARLKCNSSHGYHCVPNKQLTSLIEFCYPKGHRFPFEKGNCLKLAANGILNQVPCADTFFDGCPKDHYFSNEIFNYPKCLMVNMKFGCFEADHECIYLGVLKNRQLEGKLTTTENVANDVDTESGIIKTKDNSKAEITALAVLIIVSAILISVVFICYKIMKRRVCQNRNDDRFPKGKSGY